MRNELKYLVPSILLDELRNVITHFAKPDKYSKLRGTRGYTIRSIYLDTPSLDFYIEKIEGYEKRRKLRIRGYNEGTLNESPVFLEIKRKEGAKIEKQRVQVPYLAAASLLDCADPLGSIVPLMPSPQADADMRAFLFHARKRPMRPINLVVYEREAFEGHAEESLRLTLDKNLRAGLYPAMDGLYEEKGLYDVVPGHFILEVKFDHFYPVWLRPFLSRHQLKKQALSKYVMAIDRFDLTIGRRDQTIVSQPTDIAVPLHTLTPLS
ncbi:MAG: polyphosphate polymerase domain-containing protein [Bacteroidota bacterium]